MTPKEKANELVDKMYFSRRYKDEENYIPKQAFIHAKQCALIAVDEIIKALYIIEGSDESVSIRYYWIDVKKELERI